jgi:RNA polymerase sigma-32 factor
MNIAPDPALSRYRTDLSRRAPLSPEEERELAVRCQKGERGAARRLIEGCLGAVMRVAREYRRWGLPIEDLVQEGNIGLLKAVSRFDPSHGVRLAAYAQYWIRSEIREYVARYYRVVRVGASKGERRALRLYRKTREQRPEVLAAMSGLSTERAAEILPILVHGEASLSPGPEGHGPLDRLADEHPTAEEALREGEARARLSGAVAEAVSTLSAREQDLVRRRLLSEEPVTLEQLGAAWGVSKQRVQQIEQRVKTQMRAHLAPIAGEVGYAVSA